MLNLHTLICNLLPVRQNKVVLYAVAERYGDNMRYVGEEMQRRSSCDIVWVSEKNKVKTPKGMRSVCGRYAMRRELSTAHIIVADGRIAKFWDSGFVKKAGQVYIQAGYGSFGIAKEEVDVHTLIKDKICHMLADSKHLDFLNANCTWRTMMHRCNYLFNGTYTQYGNPRNDILQPEKCGEAFARVRKQYGLENHKRIALYVPELRSWKKSEFPPMDYAAVLTALRDQFGGEWVLLIRRSPLLSEKEMRWLLPMDSRDVVDVWDYHDMGELLAAADAVIGDYSESVFDFMLTGRPIFFYTPDSAAFELHRGFYESPGTLPFPIASNNEGLVLNILNFNIDHYRSCVSEYLVNCGNVDDGKAAVRLCNLIEEHAKRPLPEQDIKRRKIIKDFIYHTEEYLSSLNSWQRTLYVFGGKIREYPVVTDLWKGAPIQQGKILFFCGKEKGYWGDFKTISEEIIRQNLDYDLVWIVSSYILHYTSDFPARIRLVVCGTTECQYECATAQVKIEDGVGEAGCSEWNKKRRGQSQVLIPPQMLSESWVDERDSLPLKRANKKLRYYKNVDYFVSGNASETRFIKRTFSARGKVHQIGYPRNDIFTQGDCAAIHRQVCHQIGLDEDQKIVLYVSYRQTRDSLRLLCTHREEITNAFAERLGNDWIFRVVLPYDARLEDEVRNSIEEVVAVHDVQKFIVAANALISDSLSLLLDYGQVNRPAFHYDNRVSERVVSIRACPFHLNSNINTLLHDIENYNESDSSRRYAAYCVKDGRGETKNSTYKVVSLIKQIAPNQHMCL